MTDVIFHVAYSEAMCDPLVQSILKRHKSRNEALLDPELNAAFDKAFEAARQTITADPFEHERKEAARLRAKVQSEYSKPGLLWRYHGEVSPPLAVGIRWVNAMGYWTGDDIEPDDIAAVSSLLQCLTLIDRDPTESGRMLMAKRLIVLLQRAQKACNEIPEPPTYCLLTKKQKEVVSILWSNGVRSIHDGVKRQFIVDLVENSDPNKTRDPKDVQRDIKDLRDLKLILANGERAAMTYWLSSEGIAMGEYLNNT